LAVVVAALFDGQRRFPMNEGAKMTSKLWFAGVTLLFATGLNAQQPPAGPRPQTPPTGQAASPSTPGKPDITSTNRGIILGGAVGGARGKFVPWGGFADLSDVEPLSGTIANGRCAFNAAYEEINIGSAATSPNYTNKLKLDGASDVAVNSARHLNAGESKPVATQVYLNEGSHSLTLSLDDGNLVAESNEGNNQFSIKYSLKCKGQPGKIILPPASVRKPDLVPVLTNPMSGHLLVKNIGTGPAGASKLVLECHKAGHTGTGSGCAEIPADVEATYSDPAFPNKLTVHVPPLAPGAAWTTTLPFWSTLKWSSGKFEFKAVADAANTVAESNETNNTMSSTLTVR
jgi:hypothetical protein